MIRFNFIIYKNHRFNFHFHFQFHCSSKWSLHSLLWSLPSWLWAPWYSVSKSILKMCLKITELLMFRFSFSFWIFLDTAEACVGHDGVCHGAHGSQGDCCGGTYCHKNDPSWGEGRCYYRTWIMIWCQMDNEKQQTNANEQMDMNRQIISLLLLRVFGEEFVVIWRRETFNKVVLLVFLSSITSLLFANENRMHKCVTKLFIINCVLQHEQKVVWAFCAQELPSVEYLYRLSG